MPCPARAQTGRDRLCPGRWQVRRGLCPVAGRWAKPHREMCPHIPRSSTLLPAEGQPSASLWHRPRGLAGWALGRKGSRPAAKRGSENVNPSSAIKHLFVTHPCRGRPCAGCRGRAGTRVPLPDWRGRQKSERAVHRAPRVAALGSLPRGGETHHVEGGRGSLASSAASPTGTRPSGLALSLPLPLPLRSPLLALLPVQVWGWPCREPPVRVLHLPGGDRGTGQAQADGDRHLH